VASGERDARVTDLHVARTERGSSLAGVCALLAGLAWVMWVAINMRTHGGLDAGPPAIGEGIARVGVLLMMAWNLMLLPAALELESRLGPRAPERMRLATVAGIASVLFWAYGGATRTNNPVLEVAYIGMSAVWWRGVGLGILPERRAFGIYTLVLALFAAWDAFLTAFPSVPFALYLTASPKLPLSIVWDFWLAFELLRPRAMATRDAAAKAA